MKEEIRLDVELTKTVSYDEFIVKLVKSYADFLEQDYSRIYFLLRSFRVKYVNEKTVKTVAAFLAYYLLGIRTCTERMVRYLYKEVVDESLTGGIMPQLHRLGDFKVITVIRTPSDKFYERYRFLLTEQFLDHTGHFWEKK